MIVKRDDDDDGKPQGSLFERHLQTVIAAMLLALVIWTGNTLLTIKDDVTALKVQVAAMQIEIRNNGDDRFRGSDWRREREIIEDRFRRLEILMERHTVEEPPRRIRTPGQ